MASTLAQALLAAGTVRFNFYNPTTKAWDGWGDPLGADQFEITPQSETKEKTSKKRESYGQSIATVVISQPTQISIAISALDRQVLAAQFQGTSEDWKQAAGTITDLEIVALLDKWVPTGKRQLTETLTVKNSAGDKTYVFGTDYDVNYASGEIKALSTGEIAANEALKVNGQALALDGVQITGGTRAQVRTAVKFEGVNTVDDKAIEVEVYEAVLTSNNGFDFLAEDFTATTLSGTLVVPVGKSASYVVRLA